MPSRLAIAFVLLAAGASAQTADEIVARHVEARGGAAALAAIQTLRIERTVAATFTDIDVVIIKKRPAFYRSEQKAKTAPAPIIRGFAPGVAWESANGKTTVREGAGAVEQREVDADFDGFLVGYREKGHRVELEGRQRVGATDAWKLKVMMMSGAVRYVYLDPETWLDVRHEGTIELGPGRRVATTINFSDWRDVNGVKFPFAIDEERDAPGQTFVIYTRKIEANLPVDDAVFGMPVSGGRD